MLDILTGWDPNINPFLSRYPAYEVKVNDLLWQLGAEMRTPLRYNDDTTKYRGTQLLCEFFNKSPVRRVTLFEPPCVTSG